jgi:hypothetical protein
MQVFKSIQDDDVVASIGRAKKRLVYIAPGVSAVITKALARSIEAKATGKIMIVLDADEEVCRLGYCDAPSLEALMATATKFSIPIRHQQGIRLGLLMSDDEVLIWTPSPLMFEAPRTGAQTNGLFLTPQTLAEMPKALGVDPDQPGAQPQIGQEVLEKEVVKQVVAAIKAAPPAPFDLSRLSRVFSAKFQFIETVLRGAELIKREMRLDSLIVNSDADEELQALLHTTVQPFNTDADKEVEVGVLVNGEQAYRKDGSLLTRPTTQAEIRAYWDDLAARYIINLPGFGKLIRHSDKIKFEAGKTTFEIVLKAWVDGFTKLVKGDHETRVAKLVDLIEKRMAQASPKRKLTRLQIAELVRKGLDNLRVIEPSVKLVYKNITVESTSDSEFLDVLEKAVPAEELKGWFHIFDAAPRVELGSIEAAQRH